MMSGMLPSSGRRARVLVIAAMVVVLAALAGCRRLPTHGAAGPEGPRASSSSGGDQASWIRSGGILRSYLVHLPAGASSAAGLPVVLAFHGRGGPPRA